MANMMDDLLSPFKVKGQTPLMDPAIVAAGPTPWIDPAIANAGPLPVTSPVAAPVQEMSIPSASTVTPDPVADPAALQAAIAPHNVPAQTPLPTRTPTVSQTEMTTAYGNKLSDQDKAKENVAFDNQQRAIKADADLKAALAEKTSLINQDAQLAMNMQLEDNQKKANAIAAKQEEASQAWQKKVDEYDSIRKKDPHEEVGVGQTILAAIAQGLGAFGAAMTGGQNMAQQIVARAASARVSKWEKDIENARGRVDLAQNGVAYFRQQGMDAKDAAAAANVSLLNQADIAIKVEAGKFGSEQVQAAAASLIAGNEAARAKHINDQKLSEQDRQVGKTVSGPAQIGPKLEDVKKLQDMANDHPELKIYRSDRQAADRFRALVAAKADGPAVMDFIATGMKQGSFTPAFVDMLKKRNILSAAGEAIRSRFMGGYDPELIATLQSSLNAAMVSSHVRAKPVLKQLEAMGLPQTLAIGGTSEEDKAAQMGGQAQ